MNDLIALLVDKARKIYPTYSEYYADPEAAFLKVAELTQSRPVHTSMWTEIILQIRSEFPETYTEDRTIPDIYDPGLRMHFYDKDDHIKMVFVKSLLANVIGVYSIDLKARPSYDSITSNHTLYQILESQAQLQIYHRRICEILTEWFQDHIIFPSEADSVVVEDIVAPLSGDGGVGKPVKLFYLFFGDNIW